VPYVLQVLCISGESRIVGVEYSPGQSVSRGAYSCCIFGVYSAANASIESQVRSTRGMMCVVKRSGIQSTVRNVTLISVQRRAWLHPRGDQFRQTY
jgi:hypothetical protein